jgi:hypothetical protein
MPYPVADPAAWSRALRSSVMQATSRAEVWGDGDLLGILRPTGGRVSVDATRNVRRTSSLTLADETGTLTPSDARDLLAPYGNEIYLWRGLRYLDGTTQDVPLGVFITTDVEATDGDSGVQISVVGSDRSLRISRNRWTDPYTIAAGTNLADGITALLTNRWADVVTAFNSTAYTLPLTVLGADGGSESDPWKDALDIAAAAGLDLYFDPDGVARMRPLPDLADIPVTAEYVEGVEATILDVGKRITAEGLYNGVIATGEGTDLAVPVRGEAWDENPASPTYRFGRLGSVPRFYSSPLIRTAAQAQSAARAMLSQALGATEQVSWSIVPDPTLEAYDVVRVARQRLGVDAEFIVDSFEVPLEASASMSVNGRSRTWAV